MTGKKNRQVLKEIGFSLANRLNTDFGCKKDRRLYTRIYMRFYRLNEEAQLSLEVLDREVQRELRELEARL